MNAHINPFRNNKERRAFAKDCAKQLDGMYKEILERKQKFTYWRLIAMLCLYLNESLGFGKKRLEAVLNGITKQCEDFLAWDDDKTVMLDRALRRIGMEEIADCMRAAEKECAEAPEIGGEEDE